MQRKNVRLNTRMEKDITKFKKDNKFIKKNLICDCNEIRTHNHVVCERTLNQFAKLTKWLSCIVSPYLFGAFHCVFLSCNIPILK